MNESEDKNINIGDEPNENTKSEENIVLNANETHSGHVNYAKYQGCNSSADYENNIEMQIDTHGLESNDAIKNKRGFRTFVIILVAAIALSATSIFSYYIGKSSSKTLNSGAGSSLQLEAKPTENTAYSAEQIYDSVNKSVVGISIYNSEGLKGYASGIVYSEDGYIITNDHIYSDVPDAAFKIYTFDGSEFNAEYIAGDTRSDIALLKINSDGFYPATFGNSDELRFGESVLAIGRPSDATQNSSITSGIVSFLNRRVTNSTSYASKLIQTDSAINPGSSGGALVNMYGQIVGITSSKIVDSEYEGVGYAIPSTTVKAVIDELIKNGRVTNRAKLGISYREVDSITAEINKTGITGLYVASVSDESDLSGKVKVGDIITTVNGTDITNGNIVLDIIENSLPGDTLTLGIYSTETGSQKTVTAKLIGDEGTSSYEKSGPTFDFPNGY